MLWIHPIIQLIGTGVGLYALLLGIQRFRLVHLRQKALFNWKRHVWIGTMGLILWITGLVGGIGMVWIYWQGFLMTGMHGVIAMILLPLMGFGLISGIQMDRVKKKRPLLPLIHGVNNLIVCLLALWQIKSGWDVYWLYVAGG